MELSPALRFDGGFSERSVRETREQKPAIKIGIVGCGSRGLTVLERLCALAQEGERQVEIHVFDPQRPGPGLHLVDQPAYLMLNTVASQISMFPDQAALGGLSGRQGPNFYEWCLRFKATDRAVRPDEFLPRAWLGEYLAWTYDEVIRSLPAQVQVIHHARAVDNLELTDSGCFELSTGEKRQIVDWLLLTIGHAQRFEPDMHSELVTRRLNAYPQPHALLDISSTYKVLVEGLGLSAMDVVSGLTVGKGGRFVEGPEGLSYQASGHEPQVFMYSRSGLPYRTRPDIAPHRVSGSPLIFTLSAVAALRADNPQGLDFEFQVLPLLKAEMFAEYFGRVAELQGESAMRVKSEVAQAFYAGHLSTKCDELAKRFLIAPLDESTYNPRSLQASVDNYAAWVAAYIQDDLNESICGLDHSPIKAAVEVWRSCREQLRRIVDNRGLTTESHRLFFEAYTPLVNRMVAGPQKERHQELLALVRAGVVRWVHTSEVMHNSETGAVSIVNGQRDPIVMNALISAHGNDARSKIRHPHIIRQLQAAGVIHISNIVNACIDVDSHGKAQPNLWITGPIVEGATYYNHYVPSSGSYSRAFVDADRIAREMLGIMAIA